jgi:Transcriptional regulatory protein, C terminal
MSVLAIADLVTASGPEFGSLDAAATSHHAGSPRLLRSLPGGASVQHPVAAGPADAVTVTITVAPDALLRHPRVFEALRELVAAAGTERAGVEGDLDRDGHADGSGNPPAAIGHPFADPVRLDPEVRSVTRGGVPVTLSRLEYDLLLFLAEHPRQVFTRAQLLQQVWDDTHTGERTVDVHVSRLRTKLGEEPPFVTTVYGVGYRLADEAPVVIGRA